MEFANDTERECFLLFDVTIFVLVAFILLLKNEVESPIVICAWVWPVVSPEGLCHVVHGGTDCAFNQGIESVAGEPCLTHCLGES